MLLTFLTATGAGVLGSNLSGLLMNYAFTFEESNTKLSVLDNSGILVSLLTDALVFGIALTLERILGIILIIVPLVLLTFYS